MTISQMSFTICFGGERIIADGTFIGTIAVVGAHVTDKRLKKIVLKIYCVLMHILINCWHLSYFPSVFFLLIIFSKRAIPILAIISEFSKKLLRKGNLEHDCFRFHYVAVSISVVPHTKSLNSASKKKKCKK